MNDLLLMKSSKLKVFDGFNRADSALSLGNTDTGQAWLASVGTWGISSGKAYNASATSSGKCGIDSGLTDGKFSAELFSDNYTSSNPRVPNFTFRGIDSSNFLSGYVFNGNLALDKVDGGVSTTLASVAQIMTDGATYSIDVICNGTNIIISVNGANKINYTLAGTDATKFTAANCTRIGFRTGGTTNLANVRFDSLKAEVI